MGMCMLTCDICYNSFTDYDDYKSCEGCGNMWCENCTKGQKFEDDDMGEIIKCPICKNKELLELSEKAKDARIKFCDAVHAVGETGGKDE